ncbi:MAG: Tm-1-like ATP-binding domain-containing protein [Firmicutes bacterium]|nr:Tm-1-like ATP-binding domain-containing protein [Bacillota bacterium]
MPQKCILVTVNLDTRGPEFAFVKEAIEKRGLKPIIMDFSMEMEPPSPGGDITCEEVAKAGGMSIEEVRYNYNKADRNKVTENQITGGRKIAQQLFKEGKIHGAFGVGGGTSTLISTSIMKILPFGFPKLMASPMAAHPRYIDKYVGTKDITMHHTVLDIVGLNPLLKMQMMNAVGAICGMVEMSEGWGIDKKEMPVVAVTGFGSAERAVEHAIGFLENLNYQPIVCHSQGVGDKAMDEMIADGFFDGVIDFVTGGISDELFNGNCAGGPNRILAACRAKVPQVVCPGGLDKISYGGRSDLQERFSSRKMKITDFTRVQVRTSPEECEQIARVVAERLNEAVAPTIFLYPQKGWSAMSEEGMHLYYPEAHEAFLREIKEHLKKEIKLVEVPLALNSREFARKAVEMFDQLYKSLEKL